MKKEQYINYNRPDFFSRVLKLLLIATFIFIYSLLLFGDSILTVHFALPNYLLFAIAAGVLFVFIRCGRRRHVRTVASGESLTARATEEKTMTRRKENCCLFFASLVVLGIQAFITYNIIFRTAWDVAAVWYGSHWVAMGDAAGIQEMSEYFSIYPNNLLLVYIFSRILKLNLLLGEPVSNGGLLLALVQCVMMNVSGVILFKCAKRFVNQRACWCIYLLYMILVGTSGWMVLPYSDGMGVIFPVLLLYLYLRCKECQRQSGKYLYILALFVIAVIAYHIKPYADVVLIAEVLIEATAWGNVIHHRGRVQWKKGLIAVMFACAGLVCSSALIEQATHSMGFALDAEREMGIPHYLMLGANVNSWGGYSDEDLAFGNEYSSKELRNDAELEEFKSRLKNMGVYGYAELFAHKAAKNFLDGTYSWRSADSFYVEIYPSRGKISDTLRSWYYGFGALYPYNALIRQLLWIGLLILTPFAAFTKRELTTTEKALVLSVLGVMLYLQIFESQARYVMVFVPLYLILAFVGLDNLCKTTVNTVRNNGIL